MSEAIRHEVNYLYSSLNWNFIKLMAEIAKYADTKYGRAENYTESILTRDKAPFNHIPEHMRLYMIGEPHDHFKTMEHHLAAIAYNAMMEYFYYCRRGIEESEFYKGNFINATR